MGIKIPSVKDLEKAYHELMLLEPEKTTLKKLALYANWSRFDPRLAEIWVAYIAKQWETLNPLELHNEISQTPWPGTAAVLLEFVNSLIKKNNTLFTHWKALVLTNVKKADNELFFMGLRTIGSEAMLKDAEFASLEYKKWGYLAKENLAPKVGHLSYPKETRLKLLKTLFDQALFVSPKDYWLALEKSISLRQAERDMRECAFVKATGKTKARRYSLSKKHNYS